MAAHGQLQCRDAGGIDVDADQLTLQKVASMIANLERGLRRRSI
jgi:hypothetical protein